MSGDGGIIEREDLERLSRHTSAANALFETGSNLGLAASAAFALSEINSLVEGALARGKRYHDGFLAGSQLVSERLAQHRAQTQTVIDLETRLAQNHETLSETQLKLKRATEDGDIETAAHSNNRIPAIQFVIDNLEKKLKEAREELATRWLLLDTARGQLGDIRRIVDQESSEMERRTAQSVHDNDPRVVEIRARHHLQSNPSDARAG